MRAVSLDSRIGPGGADSLKESEKRKPPIPGKAKDIPTHAGIFDGYKALSLKLARSSEQEIPGKPGNEVPQRARLSYQILAIEA